MECGGHRVSDLQSAALRRECWRALDLFSVLGKSLPERNLGFLGLRDGRRPSPETGEVGSFFASFFSIGFWRLFFDFGDVRLSLWTPKIFKNRQNSTSEAFLFPSRCDGGIFADF